MIQGIEVYPIRNLRQTWGFINGAEGIPPFNLDRTAFFKTRSGDDADFEEVKGQHHVKRAMEVAAAGGHNLLMVWPILTAQVAFLILRPQQGRVSLRKLDSINFLVCCTASFCNKGRRQR